MSRVTIIVVHDIKSGTMDAAAGMMRESGKRMAALEGFVNRELLAPVDGSDVLVTITGWASLEAYEAWLTRNRANSPKAGAESLFLSSPTPMILRSFEDRE